MENRPWSKQHKQQRLRKSRGSFEHNQQEQHPLLKSMKLKDKIISSLQFKKGQVAPITHPVILGLSQPRLKKDKQ